MTDSIHEEKNCKIIAGNSQRSLSPEKLSAPPESSDNTSPDKTSIIYVGQLKSTGGVEPATAREAPRRLPLGFIIRGNNAMTKQIGEREAMLCSEGKLNLLKERYTEMIGRVNSGSYGNNKYNRWFKDGLHGWLVRKKFLEEVAGLRRLILVVLTFKPDYVKQMLGDRWILGIPEWLVACGGILLRRHLQNLRDRMRSKGKPLRYVGYTMEFQRSGMAHFNTIYFGHYLMDIDEIHRHWPWAERQGVDVKRMGSREAVTYCTKYISKFTDMERVIDRALCERLKMVMFLYKTRQYNIRRVGRYRG